jgi:predicted DNA repair protein MutK
MLKRHQDLFPQRNSCVVGDNKGSFKQIDNPTARFVLSYFVPWLITVVLILGAVILLSKVPKKYTNT